MISAREKPRLGNVSINSLPFLTLVPPTRPETQGAERNRHLLHPNATRPMPAGKVLLYVIAARGNWRDADTVPEVLRDLEQRFGLKRVLFVGDTSI
jgi:hypothetical protein